MQLNLTPNYAKFQGAALNNINFSKALQFVLAARKQFQGADHYEKSV